MDSWPLTSLSRVTCLLPGCKMKHKHIILNNLGTHIIGIIKHPHFRIWTFSHVFHKRKMKYTEHTDILFRFGILLRWDSYYGPSLRDDTMPQDVQGFRGVDLDSSTIQLLPSGAVDRGEGTLMGSLAMPKPNLSSHLDQIQKAQK